MKTSKWLILAVIATIIVGGVTVARARAQARQLQRPLQQRLFARASERLGLTDDQTAKIKAELSTEKDNIAKLLTALHDTRVGLRQTVQTAGVSENEVRGAAAKAAAAEADLAVERAKLYGKISPILTAQQLARINELQQRVDDLVDGAIAMLTQRLAE